MFDEPNTTKIYAPGGRNVTLFHTVEYALFCIIGVLVVSLWPPEKGEMVVYYPFANSDTEALDAIFSTEAKLIADGPIANSWIVWFDHPQMKDHIIQQGGFLLGTNGFHGCAGQQQTRATLEKQGYLKDDKL